MFRNSPRSPVVFSDEFMSDQVGRANRRLQNPSRYYSSNRRNKEVVVSPVCPTLAEFYVLNIIVALPPILYCWNNLSDVGVNWPSRER